MSVSPHSAPERPRRVFIVGCRRSGTTWLMLLLAQHPEVVALQQTDFFRRLAHFGRWFESDDPYGMCLLARSLRPELPGQKTKDGLLKLPLKAALPRELWLAHARGLARGVWEGVAACSPGATTVVEQTPEYVRAWEHVLEIFPDASFLHVVRDPRSVFCSHKSAAKSWADPTRFSHDPISVAREWCHDVARGREIPASGARYLEVGYEALRADPVPRLAEIFAWLGLQADRALCERAVEACSLDKMKESVHAPQGFFRSGETEGWRREMSAGELDALEYVAGDLMRTLGYRLANQGPLSPPLRLRVRKVSEGARNRLGRWAWSSDGVVRKGAARVLKAFPGLRRTLLKGIKKPV